MSSVFAGQGQVVPQGGALGVIVPSPGMMLPEGPGKYWIRTASSVAFPELESWVCALVQAPVCWPFKSTHGILADSSFTVTYYAHLALWLMDPCVGMRPPCSSVGSSALRYPSSFSAPTFGCRCQPSASLLFLPVSIYLHL